MKFTIEGFSQEELIRLGCDTIDAHLLRWFVDFQNTSNMESIIHNKKAYFWVSYPGLSDDMPILHLDAKSVAVRFARFVKRGIMAREVKNFQGGKRSYYRVIPSVFTALVTKSSKTESVRIAVKTDLRTKKIESGNTQENNTLQVAYPSKLLCENGEKSVRIAVKTDLHIKDDPSTTDQSTTTTPTPPNDSEKAEQRGGGGSLPDNSLTAALLAQVLDTSEQAIADLVSIRKTTLNEVCHAVAYAVKHKGTNKGQIAQPLLWLRNGKDAFDSAGGFLHHNGTRHIDIPTLQAWFYRLPPDEQKRIVHPDSSNAPSYMALKKAERWLNPDFQRVVFAASQSYGKK